MCQMNTRHAGWIIVALALLSGALAPAQESSKSPASKLQPSKSQEKRPSADEVLQRVKDRYQKLDGYHFEHTLTFHTEAAGKKPVEVARARLITASQKQDDPLGLWGEGPFSFNLKRMRSEAIGKKFSFLMACDGETGWVYSSAGNQYIERPASRQLYGPTASTMFQAVHLAPLRRLCDGSLQEPKLLDDETLTIGQEKRVCYVLECQSKPPELELPDGRKVPSPLATSQGLLMLLMINGLSEGPMAGPGAGPSAPVQLWIDQASSAVWQIRQQEPAKTMMEPGAAEPGAAAAGDAILTMLDQFTVARFNDEVQAEVFRFVPPPNANQVEKFEQAGKP
jgi:outer membrane lipoprotein-sorting protein